VDQPVRRRCGDRPDHLGRDQLRPGDPPLRLGDADGIRPGGLFAAPVDRHVPGPNGLVVLAVTWD
jgi:hypothetical protein